MSQFFTWLLVAIVGSAWVDRTAASQIDLYIIAGQSNAVGWCSVDQLPPHLEWMKQPQTDILWRNTAGSFTSLQPLVTPYGTTFGPELTMGRTLKDANPGQDLLLLKQAAGSTSLAGPWNSNGGAQYNRLLFRLGITVNYLETHGHDVNIKGLAWIQGEEDSKWESMGMSYEQNLQAFVESVREDIQADLPIVIARINAPTTPFRDLVRDAQQNIDILGVKTIDTDDLPLQDKVHYSGVGQVALGIRLASAFEDASHELPPSGPILLQRVVPEPSGIILGVLSFLCFSILLLRRPSESRT
jgi:hypothetical protein